MGFEGKGWSGERCMSGGAGLKKMSVHSVPRLKIKGVRCGVRVEG